MLFAIAGFAVHSMTLSMPPFSWPARKALSSAPQNMACCRKSFRKRLSWGNGVIELGTFLAAITGTVVGARLSEVFAGREYYSGIFFLACSIVGLATSFGISKIPAADPAKQFRVNFLGDLWSQGKLIGRDRVCGSRSSATPTSSSSALSSNSISSSTPATSPSHRHSRQLAPSRHRHRHRPR